MKILFAAIVLISSFAFAQSSNDVTPTPTDEPGTQDSDVKGAITPATPAQKATVEKPAIHAPAKPKHKAVKKAKKAKTTKKSKKSKKTTT